MSVSDFTSGFVNGLSGVVDTFSTFTQKVSMVLDQSMLVFYTIYVFLLVLLYFAILSVLGYLPYRVYSVYSMNQSVWAAIQAGVGVVGHAGKRVAQTTVVAAGAVYANRRYKRVQAAKYKRQDQQYALRQEDTQARDFNQRRRRLHDQNRRDEKLRRWRYQYANRPRY